MEYVSPVNCESNTGLLRPLSSQNVKRKKFNLSPVSSPRKIVECRNENDYANGRLLPHLL